MSMSRLSRSPRRCGVGLALSSALLLAASLAVVGTTTAQAAESPTCFGQTPTITGTADRDEIVGTDGDDVIVGLGGSDFIVGGEGNDLICAAADAGTSDSATLPESDFIAGEQGDDKLLGTSAPGPTGHGLATGGAGDDLIRNAAANYGESPRGVRIDLEAGTATGRGHDTLVNVVQVRGSHHDDVIDGNDDPVDDGACGCDTLYGSGGDDEIHAFRGRDEIYGGNGADRLFGGRGQDTIYPDRGEDLVNGGRGTHDVLNYNLTTARTEDAGVFVDLREGVARGRGHDTIKRFEDVTGTLFKDELRGNADNNTMVGLARADKMRGRKGADLLYGQNGDDRLRGGKGRDSGFGGLGDDLCRTEVRSGCEE